MSTPDLYEQTADSLCDRASGICRVGPFEGVDRATLIAAMRKRWPTSADLEAHLAREGVAVTFHLSLSDGVLA